MSMEAFTTKKEQTGAQEDKKPRFTHLLDEENVEVKRLEEEDVEDAVRVMRKCAFDVTEVEVLNIIKYGMSFGCHVNRMLIGVGLSWPAYLDMETHAIKGGEPNAIYMEDPAVLLAYEGRGIRRVLLKEREKEAAGRGMKYTIAYLYEDLPKGSVVDQIKESGSQLEKLYLSEGYEFFRTERGILSMKRV